MDVKDLFSTIKEGRGALRFFRRELVVLVLLVVSTFLVNRFVYSAGDVELEEIETRMVAVAMEKKMAQARISAVDNLRRSVAEAEKRLEAAEKRLAGTMERLPTDRQVSRILADIATEGFTDGVRITSVKPLDPSDAGGVTRLKFQLQMESRFVPLGEYLSRLENLPRLVVVDNFLVETHDGPGLSGQIYLSAYVLDPVRGRGADQQGR